MGRAHEIEERAVGTTRTLVAVLVVIATVFALRETETVTLPLAFALFLAALFWPLQRWLERRTPRPAAFAITTLAFLVALGLFVGGLWLSLEMIEARLEAHQQRLVAAATEASAWLERRGVPMPSLDGNDGGWEALHDAFLTVSRQVFGVAGGIALTIGFLLLALLEIPDYRSKLRRLSRDPDRARLVDGLHRASRQFQRYVVVRTFIGALTGVIVGVVCAALGLEAAFVWGFSTFVLNYIPTIGSVVATAPPVLFAIVQFDDPLRWIAVFVAVATVQIVMGVFVDPRLEGRFLRVSPIIVLISVTFWGWVWGIAGAFISVPTTLVIALICREFDATRWIATMLTDEEAEPSEPSAPSEPSEAHPDQGATART